jgi:hypothetical protein
MHRLPSCHADAHGAAAARPLLPSQTAAARVLLHAAAAAATHAMQDDARGAAAGVLCGLLLRLQHQLATCAPRQKTGTHARAHTRADGGGRSGMCADGCAAPPPTVGPRGPLPVQHRNDVPSMHTPSPCLRQNGPSDAAPPPPPNLIDDGQTPNCATRARAPGRTWCLHHPRPVGLCGIGMAPPAHIARQHSGGGAMCAAGSRHRCSACPPPVSRVCGGCLTGWRRAWRLLGLPPTSPGQSTRSATAPAPLLHPPNTLTPRQPCAPVGHPLHHGGCPRSVSVVRESSGRKKGDHLRHSALCPSCCSHTPSHFFGPFVPQPPHGPSCPSHTHSSFMQRIPATGNV